MSWAPLFRSFEIALIATALAGLLGVALAGVLARFRVPGSALIEAVLTAPMVLPPTVLGYYLLIALGRTSAIGRAWETLTGSTIVFTLTGAVIAAALSAFPFILKSARAAMDEVDPRLIGAAQTLGASPLRVFLSIVVPLSSGGIVAGLTLGFARALGEFGVTLMIAGNLPGLTQTGSIAIYDAVQGNREADAAGLALVMTALAIAALWWVGRLTRRRQHAW